MCPFRRLKQSAKSLYVSSPSGVFQMRGWIFSLLLQNYLFFLLYYTLLFHASKISDSYRSIVLAMDMISKISLYK